MNRGKRGGGAPARGGKTEQRPKKEAILNLAKYQDKQVRVKFTGGREVVGVLKGFDGLMNLVLDNVKEYLLDTNETRELGLIVVRGPTLVLISPVDGSEEIANPF
ncbi:LSM domain-domain-containing protein [Protomyces lactucae-debilis]|uniref:LSM domain-domain-containing protein n=1 Tax=Protomyces lactucae-debilis TaxID=2754530 RepID=A0A1Y2FQL0_PROLT|nr:LSM domain-containing protein [Protomyces lactucae-debilis]ORY86292.1 LSM domain-domain-containing protein [Protomyces lactucae-debilis]